jgi:phosphatidate cytidylyltransferase
MAASALLLLQPLVAPALPATSILSLTWVACLAIVSLSTTRPDRRELDGLFMMVCGVFSVTLPLGQLIALRYLAAGRAWVVLVIVTVAAREAFAVVGGVVLPGTPSINAAVSPRKTYAGWLVGAAAALVAAILVSRALGAGLTLGQAAVFGICLGAACQLGDLAESYLKRMMRQRHSSNALGPQGGLLDTTDALGFAAVVAHVLLQVWGF